MLPLTVRKLVVQEPSSLSCLCDNEYDHLNSFIYIKLIIDTHTPLVQVTAEVRAMVGHSIHPEQPLMSAGLDSRGGMELRRALGDTLHLELPVTLLYDYQSITAIVGYVDSLVEAQMQGSHTAGRSWDEEHEQERSGVSGRRAAFSAVPADKPSKLLKTLRLVSHFLRSANMC